MAGCQRCYGNCAAWTGFIMTVVASALALTSICIPLWIYIDDVVTVPIDVQANVRIYSGLWSGCYVSQSVGLNLYTCTQINLKTWWLASKVLAVIGASLSVVAVLDMALFLFYRKSYFVTCAMMTTFFAGAILGSAVSVFGYFFTYTNTIAFGPVYILGRWDYLYFGYWLGVAAAPTSVLAGFVLIRAKWVGDGQEIREMELAQQKAKKIEEI